MLYKSLILTNRNIILTRCNTRKQKNSLVVSAKHTAIRSLYVNYDLGNVRTSSEHFIQRFHHQQELHVRHKKRRLTYVAGSQSE